MIATATGLINMAGGLPDPSTWPVPELGRLAASAVTDHPSDALAYALIEGQPHGTIPLGRTPVRWIEQFFVDPARGRGETVGSASPDGSNQYSSKSLISAEYAINADHWRIFF